MSIFGSTRKSRRSTPAFEVDQLEPRVFMSTVSWDGGAGTNSWHDKANWTNDTLPGPGDDVIISVQTDPSIVFSTGNTTIGSLLCNEDLSINGGGLTVTGDTTFNSKVFTVGGGTFGFNGIFHQSGGEFRYNSGTINGSPELSSAGLKLNGGAGAVTFMLGGNGTIAGNIAANQTVWVRGANFGSNAQITAAGSFTNAGKIRLESQDLEWETFLRISTGTLTNTGTIETNLGSNGPNRIIGSVTNQGTFKLQAGASLSLELGGGAEFKQTSGSATIAGNLTSSNGAVTFAGGSVTVTGSFRAAFGSLTWTGGTLTGTVTVAGSSLTIGPNAVSAATFIIHGAVAFSGNIAAGQTVWVQGSDDLGQANMSAPSSFTNAGLLRLESIDNQWDSAVTMQNGSVLTNQGTIEANLGTAGSRSVLGKLTNNGLVVIESGVVLFNGSFTQGASGHLEVGIAGTGAGEHGKLQSSGAVSLAGEFKADYINGFIPVRFDSIQFITGNGVSGQFNTVTLPYKDPDPDIKTLLVYSGTDVRLLITSTADMNNDGMLDLFDFLEFVNHFNAGNPDADFTGDGVLDLFDFLAFINVFNK